MEKSAIVLLIPNQEVSDRCGNILCNDICEDLGCVREDVILHQLNAKELAQAIAAYVITKSGKVRVSTVEDEDTTIAAEVRDAITYILNKYSHGSNIEDIDKFRVSIIVDAINAFNDSKPSKTVKEFKNALYIIGTNKEYILNLIKNSVSLRMKGFTSDHIMAIINTHDYYTKKYV